MTVFTVLLYFVPHEEDNCHLQPSCFLGSPKRDSVDTDVVVESIADHGCYSRSEVEPMYNSAASESQNQEVVTIIA